MQIRTKYLLSDHDSFIENCHVDTDPDTAGIAKEIQTRPSCIIEKVAIKVGKLISSFKGSPHEVKLVFFAKSTFL